ncbi:MAG: hypothetical protein JWQ89_3388 [Devosia sp.]|uniref:FecR family protein n=1 Tax=Devosia sp. TaxID=1871048 RepID=UPI0026084E9C|nr:FecR family protein [Devosia sp.]MDB5541661.1 hypothetical protein [Devosia sp.]
MRDFRGLAVAAGLAVMLACAPALAASGTALGVDPSAEAETAGKLRVLTVGADISIGDNVKTGPEGQVQIKFSDKTELVVGPNSSLVIEDYLLRDDQSAGKFAINALAGTFRFATGGAAKDRYIIKTPTGTIGVRGTAFDFNVGAEGTEVLLFHGAVLLCNLKNECVTLDGTCEIGSYDLAESTLIGAAEDTKGDQRRALREAFTYAQVQTPLMREFWVEQARQCFNQGFVNNVPESLVKDEDDAPVDNGCGGEGFSEGCEYPH